MVMYYRVPVVLDLMVQYLLLLDGQSPLRFGVLGSISAVTQRGFLVDVVDDDILP